MLKHLTLFQSCPAPPALHGADVSNAERYEWIRGHRGDPLIDEALRCADHDRDFDRVIDEAILAERQGRRRPSVRYGDPRLGRRDALN